MVKKSQNTSTEEPSGAPLGSTVKESAQQIWLAGLGAFAKAQEEGGKVFEALVKEGTAIQRKTQTVAEEKITEATTRMTSMATEIGTKASGQWDKLESIFEDRVSKALGKLGVPASSQIDSLNARIDELEKRLAASTARAAAKARAKPSTAAAPKAARKQSAARKSV